MNCNVSFLTSTLGRSMTAMCHLIHKQVLMHLAAEKWATSTLARPALQHDVHFVTSCSSCAYALCSSCAHAIVGLYVVPSIIVYVGTTSNVLRRTSSPTIVMQDLCEICKIIVAHVHSDVWLGSTRCCIHTQRQPASSKQKIQQLNCKQCSKPNNTT